MLVQSRLRSILLAFPIAIVISVVGCSDKTTDTSPIPEEEPEDNQVLITHRIFITDSDFRYPVEQYAYGDSIYIKAFEGRNLRPTLSPVWLYSYVHGDMEVFLMDDDRAPPHMFPEDYLVVIAVLPDSMTGYGPFPFDGTFTVHTGGDSITAYYFSQTHGQLITAGARIGGF